MASQVESLAAIRKIWKVFCGFKIALDCKNFFFFHQTFSYVFVWGHFRLIPLPVMPSIVSLLTCLCNYTHSNSVTHICLDPEGLFLLHALHIAYELLSVFGAGTLQREDNTLLTNQEEPLFLPHHFLSPIYSLHVFLFMITSFTPISGS